jgi:hypothetical protein
VRNAQRESDTLLYVATVHFKSPRWIEIQKRHLQKHLSVPYQTWSSLEQIDPSYSAHFDRVLEQRGPHDGKLNHLALEISHEASDDDLIMFLDGDAFPIADPMPVITDALKKAPLVAVRRPENANDPQPHPCFCVTTVGTWRSLPGDWSLGASWTGPQGTPVSDVGANLLRALELTDTSWIELLRTNGKENLHPVFFAIYADMVYHHGAGFRPPISRHDVGAATRHVPEPRNPVLRLAMRRLTRKRRWESRMAAIEQTRSGAEETQRQSDLIFDKLQRGDPDWLADVTGDGEADLTDARLGDANDDVALDEGQSRA